MKKALFCIGLLTCLFALTPLYAQNEEAAIVLKDLDHPTGCYATSLMFPDGGNPRTVALHGGSDSHGRQFKG